MDKKRILDTLRKNYPDIKWFRKSISKMRVRRTHKLLLTDDQIRAGEQNETEKRRLVQENLKRRSSLLASTKKMMNNLIQRVDDYKNRTDLKELKTDILFCRLAYGFQPDEYLCFELEHKTMEERKAFISDVEHYRFLYYMNDLSEVQIFNNKGATYQMFQQYYKRDALYISGKKDHDRYLAFVKKHPEFVRKAVYEGMGRSVELVDMRKDGASAEAVFQDIISCGPHIVEERVVQSEPLSKLNASSVNTIRCITLNTRNGIVISYCFMKIGQNGAFVDNGGAGGILVGIDSETGKLNTDGYDELNVRYTVHPNSNIQFQGYQLPDFEDMLRICKEMSAKVPRVKCIGWDMAHTEQGWIVIEGNGMTQMIGPQIVWKYGIKSEMKEMMRNMDLIV